MHSNVRPRRSCACSATALPIGEIAARAGCTLPVTSILLLEHLEDAGPRRVSQIAECQNVGMPAVTPRLKDLEREGFVTRSADPSDARVSLISLSPAGLAVLGPPAGGSVRSAGRGVERRGSCADRFGGRGS